MRGQSGRRGAWVQGRGAAPYPVFIQQTHRPSDLSPGSRHGAPALPELRSPESASVGLCLPCGATTEGALSEHLPLCPPPSCFPERILGFPQCKSWLSTLKCFNLLHPPTRALKEAGRRPRLRTIKELTAGGAPVGLRWVQGSLPERCEPCITSG